jgi:hypothetical protein
VVQRGQRVWLIQTVAAGPVEILDVVHELVIERVAAIDVARVSAKI